MAGDPSIPSTVRATNRDGLVERQFPRFATELLCLYSKDDGSNWNGTAINLSLGGCAVRGTAPVHKGDYLRILIFLSVNQAPVQVDVAPVRWASGEQFGVEFITLAPRDVRRLQTYLTSIDTES